jgi:4-amino-4-deoxy-L-arabinose transferase-like glycosyltransferase
MENESAVKDGAVNMSKSSTSRGITASDTSILLLLGLAVILMHTLVNGQYGFHRDELLTLGNARHLAWGYVVYPPMTAFLARLELDLFGTSLIGFRFFAAIAQGVILVLTGLMARELGGSRRSQLAAALAVAIGGHSLFSGGFTSYTTFDYVWWVVVAYFVARLLKSEDARWWLAIGAAIGLGLMTKYTMVFLVVGVAGGVLLTPVRRHLRSAWFWCGVAVAILIVLPNTIWQIENHFVSLEFLKSIHTRDIGWGWTNNFLLDQLWKCTNPVTLPLWCAGLWYLFGTANGKRYRLLGWMYLIPLVALFAAKGRDYYLAPAYPMLLAAGAVWGEQWTRSLTAGSAAIVQRVVWRTMAVAGLIAAALTLPIAPLGTTWWRVADASNRNFNMEIGWPELVATVAKVRTSLPAREQATVGILAADEGEVNAINLYGPAYRLPTAISGMNSNWMRGYGDPGPQTLIVVGLKHELLARIFDSCEVADHLTNPHGIENFALSGSPDVFVCRNLRVPWPEFWKHFRYYG